jgi:hypothetical protein
LTAALALGAGLSLLRLDAPKGLSAVVLLTWVPAASFLGLGLYSLTRRGLTAEGVGGSAAWWGLVLLAFAASAHMARSHVSPG